MAYEWLHGIETIPVTEGITPVVEVKSSVTALIGFSPVGEPNAPKLILKPADVVSEFGEIAANAPATIGRAVDIIRKQRMPATIIVNMYDPDSHRSEVEAGRGTVATGSPQSYTLATTIQLSDQGSPAVARRGIASLVVKDATGVTTYAVTTDYTFDALTGIVTRVSGGGITSGDTVKVSYTWAQGQIYEADGYHLWLSDQAEALADRVPRIAIEDLVVTNLTGTTTYVEGDDYSFDPETGLLILDEDGDITVEPDSYLAISYSYADPELVTTDDFDAALDSLDVCLAAFGFTPKIMLAPGFSHRTGFGSRLQSKALQFRAVPLVDTPFGLSPVEANEAKALAGEDTIICYPHPANVVTRFGTDVTVKEYLSPFIAGLIARMDKDVGYWHSPSNKLIEGIDGMERILTYAPNDADTELQYVNSRGFMSVLRKPGGGFYSFGNRTAAWPNSTAPEKTLISWRRINNMIDETIEYYTLQFLDGNMYSTPANARTELLARVAESVQDYLNALMGRGALSYGRIYLRDVDNTVGGLAAGQLVYTLETTPPPVAEHLVFRHVTNVNRLGEIFKEIIAGLGLTE